MAPQSLSSTENILVYGNTKFHFFVCDLAESKMLCELWMLQMVPERQCLSLALLSLWVMGCVSALEASALSGNLSFSPPVVPHSSETKPNWGVTWGNNPKGEVTVHGRAGRVEPRLCLPPSHCHRDIVLGAFKCHPRLSAHWNSHGLSCPDTS